MSRRSIAIAAIQPDVHDVSEFAVEWSHKDFNFEKLFEFYLSLEYMDGAKGLRILQAVFWAIGDHADWEDLHTREDFLTAIMEAHDDPANQLATQAVPLQCSPGKTSPPLACGNHRLDDRLLGPQPGRRLAPGLPR